MNNIILDKKIIRVMRQKLNQIENSLFLQQ